MFPEREDAMVFATSNTGNTHTSASTFTRHHPCPDVRECQGTLQRAQGVGAVKRLTTPDSFHPPTPCVLSVAVTVLAVTVLAAVEPCMLYYLLVEKQRHTALHWYYFSAW